MKVVTRRMVILDEAERFEIDVTTSGLFSARVQAHRLEYAGGDRVGIDGLKVLANGKVGTMYLNAHLRDDFNDIPADVLRALGIDPQEH